MKSKPMVGLIVVGTFVLFGPAVAHAQKPTDVIESAQSQLPGIQTELVEVKRMSDNTIRVQWRWRNTTDKTIYVFLRGALENETYLLDPVNKKKHFVVTDAKGNVIASNLGDGVRIDANQAMIVWVKFPAPPASVGKVSVVIAKTPPFEDVTISK